MGDVIQLDPVYPGEDDEAEARRQALESMRAQITHDEQAAADGSMDAETADIRREVTGDPPPELPVQQLPEQVVTPREEPAPWRSQAPPALPQSTEGGRPSPPAPAAPGIPALARQVMDRRQRAPQAPQTDPAVAQRLAEYQQALTETNSNKTRKRIIATIGALLGANAQTVGQALQGGDEPLQELRARRADDARFAASRGAQERQRSQDEMAQTRMGYEGRRMALAESEAARSAEMDSRRMNNLDSEAERRGRLDESIIGLRSIQQDAAAGDAAAQAQMRDPESQASSFARNLAVQQGAQTGLDITAEDLAGMSAEQVRALTPEVARGFATRRRGNRGGGGGGSSGVAIDRSAWGTGDDPLVAEAVAAGVPEHTAREMAAHGGSGTRTPRARLEGIVAQQGATLGRTAEQSSRMARMPGWDRAPDAPQLNATATNGVRQVVTADNEFTRAVGALEHDLAALRPDERMVGRTGQASERYRRVNHNLEVIRTQLRLINQSGNALGAQQMAEHSVPGLDENITAGAILANVRAARAVKHQYVLGLMEANGYEPQGHRGSGSGTAPGTVRVRMPDGRVGRVPRGNVDRLPEGAEVLE